MNCSTISSDDDSTALVWRVKNDLSRPWLYQGRSQISYGMFLTTTHLFLCMAIEIIFVRLALFPLELFTICLVSLLFPAKSY